MATVNDLIFDRTVRHQIYIERYSAGFANRMIELLDVMEGRILKQLENKNISALSYKRKEELLKRIRQLANTTTLELTKQMRKEVVDFAKVEADFQKKMLSGTLPVPVDVIAPSPQQLYSAVISKPFNGRVLKDWFSGMRRGVVDNIHTAIQAGYAEGQTTEQIVRSIKGTRSLKYKDGLTEKSRRWVRTVVRTSVNHSAATAREVTYEQNRDLIRGVQWVSTLDSRTSLICISRDTKVYKIGEGPRPPAHPNCRSTTVPIVRSFKELGISAKDVSPSTRASINGQVPQTTSYPQWLKKQPVHVQNEVLGKKKALLFRKGELSVDRFVNNRGRELTLDELKVRDIGAFEKAGLD